MAAAAGESLASVVNVLDPDVIVAGGGLSNVAGVYAAAVTELWRPYVFSDTIATRFVAARRGDASGVRGAAWLWAASPGQARSQKLEARK